MDAVGDIFTLFQMGKSNREKKKNLRRTYLREWRKFRGMTLERLAERISSTAATVSRIERGKQPYSQEVLEALAEALSCEPADIIMRDPSKPNIWSIWDAIPAAQRDQATLVLETFTKKTGTGG